MQGGEEQQALIQESTASLLQTESKPMLASESKLTKRQTDLTLNSAKSGPSKLVTFLNVAPSPDHTSRLSTFTDYKRTFSKNGEAVMGITPLKTVEEEREKSSPNRSRIRNRSRRETFMTATTSG